MMANYLVPLLAATVYISVCVVVIANRSRQTEHKRFVLYLIAAALWSSDDFLLRSDFLIEHKLILFKIVLLASLWWIVQFYHFVRAFLHLPDNWGIKFGYISLAVFAAAAALGYAPPSITYSNGAVSPEYGWWFLLYLCPMVLGPLGVYSLVQRLRTLTDSRERNKIAYLISAIAMLVIFGFTGVTPLAHNFPLSHIGGLFAACILAYAVTKHDLVSINSVLRRSLGWASLFGLGVGAYLLVFYLLRLLFTFEVTPIAVFTATLAATVTAILVYRLRSFFLEMVEQLFYRGTYSYRQALVSFNIKMGNIINLNELANEMLPTIVKALRTSHAELLFEDSSSGDFTTQFAHPKKAAGKSGDGPEFNQDSPIVTWLEKEDSPLDLQQIDFIPQLKGLWQTEKEKLATFNLEFLCPIKSRGKLIGILALGKKLPDTPYSQEDLEIIISMASQAGIMIENARMFDILKKQQIQVQQILAQAVLAQEEERQRISIDLHDSVAQWLAGASYHAQTADALLSRNINDEARDELVTVENTIDKSLKELRRVVIGLRPPALDELGLDHALRQSLEDLKSDGLICKFNEVGTRARLSSSVEIAVYRLVQEALSNIRKHANATKVNLRLQFREDELLVEIRDNGKGFDLSRTLDSAIAVGHMGLLGMKQRAEMLGGDIKIRTGEGAGTTLILSLPIQAQEKEG